MDDFQNKLDTILSVLKQTAVGPCAIAIAGAHAKGTADNSSDLDLYLFADAFKPRDERKAILQTIANPGKQVFLSQRTDGSPWGGNMDFYYGELPVEVNTRTFALEDKMVLESLAGKFEIIPATWTSNGYYTYIYLSELSFLVPIWDPEGRIARYKDMVSSYPESLRHAIIRRFMARSETWLHNFHYSTAITRRDLLFVSPIVLHTVLDMIQVVFALNRVYFTGDKKLEFALKAMPHCPKALQTEIEFLLTASRDTGTMLRQQKLLQNIHDELQDLICKL